MSDSKEPRRKWVIATRYAATPMYWKGRPYLFSADADEAVEFPSEHVAQRELDTWPVTVRAGHQVIGLVNKATLPASCAAPSVA